MVLQQHLLSENKKKLKRKERKVEQKKDRLLIEENDLERDWKVKQKREGNQEKATNLKTLHINYFLYAIASPTKPKKI